MDIEKLGKIVALWAESQSIVKRVHLFGSRVRGTHTCKSDLDVAVELIIEPSDSGPHTTWIANAEGLRSSISSYVPSTVAVDLQWYGGPIETPVIHKGLEAGSRLIYERLTTPDAARNAPQAPCP